MVPLATRNLLAEKWRFVMSVAGVAFTVLLVLIVVRLTAVGVTSAVSTSGCRMRYGFRSLMTPSAKEEAS